MGKLIKEGTALVGVFLTFIITRYHLTAGILFLLIVNMIFEDVSWKRANRKLKERNMKLKNELHSDKLSIWLTIGVVLSVEITTCFVCRIDCSLFASCVAMLYYVFSEIASFLINQSVIKDDKLLGFLQKISKLLMKSFDVAIEQISSCAEDVATDENIEKIVDKVLESKLGSFGRDAK